MNIRIDSINFQSYQERERELARLRELTREREHEMELERQRYAEALRVKQEQELLNRISYYPDIDNQMSKKIAGFLSQFTCAIQNNSEHNIMEFFGDEKTAQNLRKNLSSECQADSKQLREEIQKLDELKDPVMTLICANKMKKFAPKEGILTKEQHTNLVEGLKNTVSTIVRNSNLDKFEPEDKAVILEMVQKVEQSNSVDFGIEVKLKMLVDKLNSKKLKHGFIPPVQVKVLGKQLL